MGQTRISRKKARTQLHFARKNLKNVLMQSEEFYDSPSGEIFAFTPPQVEIIAAKMDKHFYMLAQEMAYCIKEMPLETKLMAEVLTCSTTQNSDYFKSLDTEQKVNVYMESFEDMVNNWSIEHVYMYTIISEGIKDLQKAEQDYINSYDIAFDFERKEPFLRDYNTKEVRRQGAHHSSKGDIFMEHVAEYLDATKDAESKQKFMEEQTQKQDSITQFYENYL